MTASRIHIALAALMGAAGVILWAMAAHRGGANAATAAQMLLLHAASVLGLTACRKQGVLQDRLATLATAALILGAILFSGDLSARAFLGFGLFPMAAPAGGLVLIAGWVMAGLSALAGPSRAGGG
jgi:uncharacterized membrane protein YgdD (TMEM256/DUF423 family)